MNSQLSPLEGCRPQRPRTARTLSLHAATLLFLAVSLAGAQLEAIKTLTPEEGQEVRRAVEEKVFTSTKEELPALETELLEIFQSSETTLEGKQYACRMLRYCASDVCIPVLAPELTNPELSQFVRRVFQSLETKSAEEALVAALPTVGTELQIGIIGTLGQLGSKRAVPALAPFLTNDNPNVQFTAITALGNIDGRTSLKALLAVEVNPEFSNDWKLAQLNTAEDLKGCPLGIFTKYDAETVALELLEDEDVDVRCAALTVFTRSKPKKAGPSVLRALESKEPRFRNTAIGLLPLVPTDQLTSIRLGMSTRTQALFIHELGRRGASDVQDMLILALGNDDEAVRLASIRALGQVGGTESVQVLAATALTNPAAFDALCRLNADGIDETIIQTLENSEDDKLQVKLIECLAARQAKTALPCFTGLASNDWSRTSAAAISGLANLVSEADFQTYADLLLGTENKKKIQALEKSIAIGAQRLPDADACALPLISAYGKAKGEVQYAIIRALGSIGGDAAKSMLSVSMESPDPQIRDAAIRGLCNWPNTEVQEQLLELAENADTEKHKVLALRGYIRLANTYSDEKDALPMCKKAAALTDRPEELRSIIACAKRFRSEDVINFLAPMLENPAIVDEAGQGMIEQTRHWKYKQQALPHLERYAELTENEQMKSAAQSAITNLKK